MAALQEQVKSAKAAYEAASKELQEAETQMNKVCRLVYDCICLYMSVCVVYVSRDW